MECGKKFVHLRGQYYIRYRGNAFYVTDERYIKIPINSRIMIDILYFRKINPNYTGLVINELAQSPSLRYILDDQHRNFRRQQGRIS